MDTDQITTIITNTARNVTTMVGRETHMEKEVYLGGINTTATIMLICHLDTSHRQYLERYKLSAPRHERYGATNRPRQRIRQQQNQNTTNQMNCPAPSRRIPIITQPPPPNHQLPTTQTKNPQYSHGRDRGYVSHSHHLVHVHQESASDHYSSHPPSISHTYHHKRSNHHSKKPHRHNNYYYHQSGWERDSFER